MMFTTWGISPTPTQITDGVYEIDTAGYGGIMVNVEVAQKLLSQAARTNRCNSVQT
jgi:hypothetical protein